MIFSVSLPPSKTYKEAIEKPVDFFKEHPHFTSVNLISIFPHSKKTPTNNEVHRFTDNLDQDTIADKDELHQGRRSVIMTIDAEHVSFLNMTYIFRHSSYSRTFKAAGCKQGFYVDPYKTLK